ncbi:SdrD B-like domain-containing protein [Runella aurantiaca]|uniref:SdrD B-like domain-containing protein n=1 Tax=Runella aurantiaca TaxID=2282308 RepID=UPI0013148D2E|nr:SdrD B-like domain-containing protein [Runella aurantiaca]
MLLLCCAGTTAYSQCTISISKVIVSGCYLVGSQSKATVSVEVAWTNAPTGGTITVTLGAQTRTITPGLITVTYPQVAGNSSRTGDQTIVTPQVVAFEINADGSTNNTITARFNNTCTTSTTYNAPAACPITACSGNNIGGVVFKDFNDNGVKETGESAGIASVLVKGIACDGTVYTGTTDGYGYYSLPVPANKYPVRVEFGNVPSVYKLGINGTNSRTSVQFVSAPACNVNLGLINPIDYCTDNNLRIFVPCFAYGDPLLTSGATSANLSGNADALASIPYGITAGVSTTNALFFDEKGIAKASQIGTIWGLAYNKYTKRLFQSAVLKRHAGLGPQGLGGLYVTNYTNAATPTTTSFLNVTTDLGVSVGTIANNSGSGGRGLQADKTLPSRDNDAFSKIGKVGLGDLDISDDGNKLWFVNMFDKKLYSVDITQYNQDGITKPTSANVNSFTIPATCTGGEYRPWALKAYNGKVYVGGICDAQSSGNKSNLRASVYELNGNTFTQIFDFPLTYPKGYPAAANTDITGWFPWTDTFNDLLDGSEILRHPVPMFTDIEFDIDGSMVLGFGDRTGWQGGDRNYRPDGTSTTLYETNSQAGDILRAFNANGTFVLENNAKAGPNIGYGAGNQQGPGFGEFYNDNWVQENGNVLYHAEEMIGSLALKPGSGEVVATAIDPQDRHPYAGGVRYMNNTTGLVNGFYTVYITRGPDGSPNPGTFAKATGLGDIELSCGNLEIIEIGNRVWLDTNKDGIQDACEKGLKDVNITLYKGTAKIATTKTDANGEYFFNRKSKLIGGIWSGTGADTTVLPNSSYSLVFGTGGQITNSNDTLKVSGIGKFLLTQKDVAANTANDLNDSDAAKTNFATEGGSYPIISVTTEAIASTNHTYDAGFYCIDPYNYKATVTQATCTGISANSDAKIELTDVKCADKYAFSKNSGGTFSGAAYASATALTGTTITLNNLANPATAQGDTFYVRLYNGLCCFKDTLIILPYKDCSCVKPIVSTTPKDQVTCQGETVVNYTASTTPSTGLTLKWYGPLNDTTGSLGTEISGATSATYTPTASFTGKKYFAVVAIGAAPSCADTAFVSLNINLRPVANVTAKKQSICIGTMPTAYIATPNTGVIYKWYGVLSDTTSSIGAAIDDATSANFTPTGVAITTVGTKYYAVVITDSQTSCKDTAFVQLTVSAKPIAGADIIGSNAICNTIASVDLPNAANGETWTQLGSNPKNVAIDPASGIVTGMDAIGIYQFILTNSATGCADTVAVETKNCLKGSIGDFIWKDLNDNGLQDANEPSVKGVIVQLLNGDTNALLATDTTDTNGLYGFSDLGSGNYKVKIVLNSLPDTCQISSKKDITSNGGNDTNDSDFDPTTAESPIININTLGTDIVKDNPTVDAALIIPCVKPVWTLTSTPICSPSTAVYSVSFSIANKNGSLKVNAGTLSGTNPYTVTGIPNGTNLIVTDSLRANCVFDTTFIAPDCSCPQINLLTPNATACIGDTLPTLKIVLIGTNLDGVTANWYASATGGTALATGLSFKPTGIISATDTFYVALTGAPECINQPRSAVIVTAQNCDVDLALKKLISTKIAHIGDTLTYTIKVWNEFTNNATGVEVTDSIATTVQFLNATFNTSRGSATISDNVIKWTIGNIAANGDTVTLTYKVKAVQEGVHFNTAEISKTNEKDKDSSPNNAQEGEDDTDRQCFTVPIKLCVGEKVQASVPAKYTGVEWFKTGTTEPVASGNEVLLSETGTYTFKAINNTCPAEGCCPVIIEPGDHCCPEELCVPFTIKQTKKAGKNL